MLSTPKGKKFAMISEEMYKTLTNINQNIEQTQSAEFVKIKKLDDKIQEILSNKNMPESDKARLYSMAASEYINLRAKAPETMRIMTPLQPSYATKDETIINPVDEYIDDEVFLKPYQIAHNITPIPSDDEEEFADAMRQPPVSPTLDMIGSRKGKAEEILDQITNSDPKIIDWDPNTNNIKLNGKVMPQTDISQILDYITKTNPSKQAKKIPNGIGPFLEAVGRANINASNLIPNTTLKEIVFDGAAGKQSYGTGAKHVLQWTQF